MILQNPLGLLGLLIIPVLILLKFLRSRPRTVIFPSLLIWNKVASETADACRHRRYAFILVLFIQIIVILLLSLAMSNPAFISQEDILPETVIILDNSVGMTTRTLEESTRWEKAINHLKQWLNKQPSDLQITLIQTLGNKEKIISRHITSELSAYLETLTPQETMVNWTDWLIKFLPQLNQIDSSTPFYLYSDRPLPEEIIKQLKRPPVQVLFGHLSRNIGITHIGATGEKEKTSVLVNIKNLSSEDKSVPLSIHIDGVLKAEKIVTLGAKGEETILIPEISVSSPEIIEARLDINDDLSCDNQVFLTHLPSRKIKVCLIGQPSNVLTRVLKANPLVELVYFSEQPVTDEQSYDIFIYNNITPITETNYGKIIVINPPAGFYPFRLQRQPLQFPISNFRFPTRFLIMAEVNLLGFHLWQSRAIEIAEEGKDFFRPIIKADNNVLLAEYKKSGNHIIISGFDMEWLNPKDSHTDWALTPYFPIFWTNLIHYLSDSDESSYGEYGYYKTGSYIKYLDSIPEKNGLYEIQIEGKNRQIAVNVADIQASDNNGITKLPDSLPDIRYSPFAIRHSLNPFSFWLVLIALVLLVLSWWLDNEK